MASDSMNSLPIKGEKEETVTDFIFLGSQITADRDCNHEIKKTLLPWMESYDKARDIKSKDITLPTEVHIVKAMIFFQ